MPCDFALPVESRKIQALLQTWQFLSFVGIIRTLVYRTGITRDTRVW